MPTSKEEAVATAQKDLAKRLGIGNDEVSVDSVEDAEFPDTALGAAGSGEMSGQMLTDGWRIRLRAKGKKFEYRANKHQIRLFNFKGSNYLV